MGSLRAHPPALHHTTTTKDHGLTVDVFVYVFVRQKDSGQTLAKAE